MTNPTTNPITAFFLWGQESLEQVEGKFRNRVAETSINAQKAVDENLGAEIRALDPYFRYEVEPFTKFQYAHSALKNQDIGVVCSYKAAVAYNKMEKQRRDEIIEKIKKEKSEQ